MNKDRIKDIKDLYRIGLLKAEIAKRLKIPYSLVSYHTNEKYRKGQMEYQRNLWKEGKTWKQRHPEEFRKMHNAYLRKRWKDPVYRKAKIKAMVKYQMKRYHNDPEYRRYRIRLGMASKRRVI